MCLEITIKHLEQFERCFIGQVQLRNGRGSFIKGVKVINGNKNKCKHGFLDKVFINKGILFAKT